MSRRNQHEELLARLVNAIGTGQVSARDLLKLDHDLIADGWRQAVNMLSQGKADNTLVRALRVLASADPEFPSANLLLGMAYWHTGDVVRASHHLNKQVQHHSGLHRQDAQDMLASIDRKSHPKILPNADTIQSAVPAVISAESTATVAQENWTGRRH